MKKNCNIRLSLVNLSGTCSWSGECNCLFMVIYYQHTLRVHCRKRDALLLNSIWQFSTAMFWRDHKYSEFFVGTCLWLMKTSPDWRIQTWACFIKSFIAFRFNESTFKRGTKALSIPPTRIYQFWRLEGNYSAEFPSKVVEWSHKQRKVWKRNGRSCLKRNNCSLT